MVIGDRRIDLGALLRTAIDPEVQKQLETAAADFDEMAAEIERQTNGKWPPDQKL